MFFLVRFSFYWTIELGGGMGIYYNVIAYTLISIAVLLTLPLMSNFRCSSGIVHRAVSFISLISYSMYLVNYALVRDIIVPLTMTNFTFPGVNWHRPYISYLLFWIFKFVLSALIYWYFEKPILKWRDRKKVSKEVQISVLVS
jgi:peptidoglycan/LPS O-acetylase OafA/YrhL